MSASRPFPDLQHSAAPYRYRVYGLRIRSDLRLPELFEDEGSGDADVDIRIGSVGEELGIGPGGAVLRVDNVATYRMRDGREITVDPDSNTADRNIRLFLLGSAMGVLLHQRGSLPLHANAIEVSGRAVAFMGESGAGKSTLAAWLHDAGHRVIADDVCVVSMDDKNRRARVHPGLARIRLWKDALERTGREAGDYEYSYAGDETYEKFDIPVSPDKSAEAELDLAAVYLLSVGERFRIIRLTGADAVEAIFSHTYRGLFVPDLGQSHSHFTASVDLARVTPIFRLERPKDLNELSRDIEKVLSHVNGAG